MATSPKMGRLYEIGKFLSKKDLCGDRSLSSDILDILSSAIASVSPKNLVKRSMRLKENTLMVGEREFDLSRYKKIYIIGAGKASLGMAEEVERILKDRKEG